ncbi:MAG: hypothetical protein FWG52_05335, partial [Proteobacteria bacterium]|nr:hypothetical protein [Pseudomonadota bacterium]
MSDVYVYSTLTADQEYCEWINSQIEGNPPTMGHSIIIKGGANLVTGELGWDGYHPNLYTPSGVVTRISKDDAEFLKRNPIFQIHEKKGFVRIDKKEIPV